MECLNRALVVIVLSFGMICADAPKDLPLLLNAIEKGDYNRVTCYLSSANFDSETRRIVVEKADQVYRQREINYANRSHGLYRLCKLGFCGGMSAMSGIVMATSIASCLGALYLDVLDVPLLNVSVPLTVVISAGLGVWNLHGMHNALFGAHNLEKAKDLALIIKQAVEAKKVTG